jgi:eukaryotic-like serine/threonine-protein kinase
MRAKARAQGYARLAPVGTIGRYEIIGRLAVGGMAEIFLGRETGPRSASRELVVKRILPKATESAMHVESFVHEATLGMRLRHPVICAIYEFGQEDESFYLAMEYVDGVSLRDFADRALEHGGLPVPIAAKIVADVAGALHHAHTATGDDGVPLGIVHRDVTPENIMIGFDGTVKLLDFGIAKGRSQTLQTQQGELKGKFAYMSPEQYQGSELDGRADVFSLGVCLYEALVGGTLFARGSEFETVAAILFGDSPPSVRDSRADVPEAIDAVARRAIAKSRDERFQSAEELQLALLTHLANSGWVVRETEIAALAVELFPRRAVDGPKLDRSPIRRTLRDDGFERVRESTDRYDLESMVDSVELDLGRDSRRKGMAIGFMALLVVVLAFSALGYSLLSSAPGEAPASEAPLP